MATKIANVSMLWLCLSIGAACSKSSAAPSTSSAEGRRSVLYRSSASLPTLDVPRCDAADFRRRLQRSGTSRRFALLVGVGTFAVPQVPKLDGPPQDVALMYETLTAAIGGYGFAKEDVCAVVDASASYKEVLALLGQLGEAAKASDEVLVYFSGHGTQVKDESGDEPDNLDEALVLFDGLIRDDTLNVELAKMDGKGARVTLIIDACNAATMAKGYGPRTEAASGVRYLSTELLAKSKLVLGEDVALPVSDQGAGFNPESLPNVAYLGAAQDGTSAIERQGRGLFTGALVQALADAGTTITYRQAGERVRALVTQAGAAQVPDFSGAIDREVFGPGSRSSRHVWLVQSATADRYEVRGVPLPGWGESAEIAIFAAGTRGVDLQDSSKAKVQAVLTNFGSIRSDARPLSKPRSAVQAGDVAVLVRSGYDQWRLGIYLHPDLPRALVEGITQDLEADPMMLELVALSTTKKDAFVVAPSGGSIDVFGPQGVLRNRITASRKDVVETLRLHAMQRPLMGLTGEPGQDLVNDSTLVIEVSYKEGDEWKKVPVTEGEPLPVPVCRALSVDVTYKKRVPGQPSLEVGGVLLSNDGKVFGFPAGGASERVVLSPGQHGRFRLRGVQRPVGIFPPVGASDVLLVAGLPVGSNFPWHLLRQGTVTPKGDAHPLSRALLRYTQGTQQKGAGELVGEASKQPWVTSTRAIIGQLNPTFPGGSGSEVRTREYTIQGFDIKPYLPGNSRSALHRLLTTAHELVHFSWPDGVGYRQHDWTPKHADPKTSDELNLRRGIDCSRAVWFAFTRSGLAYTSGGEYLPTARMHQDDSALTSSFARCDDEALQAGDVLVYRRSARDPRRREDGHTVIVVDPERLIAWGSHAFDGTGGNTRLHQGDTGVEYQRVSSRRAFRRWDSPYMDRVACWRHRQIAEEARAGVQQVDPGDYAGYCRDEKRRRSR